MKTILTHLAEQRAFSSTSTAPTKGDAVKSSHGGEPASYDKGDGTVIKTMSFNSESDANNFMSGKKGAYGLVGKIADKYHVAKRNTSNTPKDKQSPKNTVKEEITFEETFFEDVAMYETKTLKQKLLEQRTGNSIAWNQVKTTHGGETRSVYEDGGRVYQTYVFNTESEASNYLKANKGYGIIGRNGFQVHVARRCAKGRKTDKQSGDGTMSKGLTT